MEKIKLFLEKNHLVVLIGVILLFVINTCSSNGKISSLKKDVVSLQNSVLIKLERMDAKIDLLPDQKKIEKFNNKLMYDFLIYEDDLDNRRTSLSTIKEKIQSGE